MEEKEDPVVQTEDLISGGHLRYMMNIAKMSPGAAEGYIKDYPTYAWLFDGSFVTYIEEGG